MSQTYNVYCDESCHLENDGQSAMVLGAVWCPDEKRREIGMRLREIKARHNMGDGFELKWTKVGKTKLDFYHDYIDYFFDDDDLRFRAVIVPDKSLLDHAQHGHDHDTWYYKMYFTLLKTIFAPGDQYRVYIDIKDTLGHEKIVKLHDVLCNNSYDFSRQMIERVQRVRSHEVELLQIADLLSGALSYHHRRLNKSEAKLSLIRRIQERSHYSLNQSTLLREEKFNMLVWQGETSL